MKKLTLNKKLIVKLENFDMKNVMGNGSIMPSACDSCETYGCCVTDGCTIEQPTCNFTCGPPCV